jgi:uncharacterized delta-60 repeat protein
MESFKLMLIFLLLIDWLQPLEAAVPGSLDTSYQPLLDGPVRTIVPLPNGQALVGGAFKVVNGASRAGIVRLNADGSLDASFDPGTGVAGGSVPAVNAILVQTDGKILIAGSFTTINGTIRLAIARLNADGSLDESYLNSGSIPGLPIWDPSSIMALAMQADGKILVGGEFSHSISMPPLLPLVRLNMDGTLDQDYQSPGFNGWSHGWSSYGPTVSLIACLTNGQILVEGFFTGVGVYYIPRLGLARLNANGGVDGNFHSRRRRTEAALWDLIIRLPRR